VITEHAHGTEHVYEREAPSGRYFHNSDHVFAPGDVIRPAHETGHASRWADHEGYSPKHVYVWHEHGMHDNAEEAFEEHGRHTYEVEPLGHVEDDPEKHMEGEVGAEAHAYRTSSGARVVKAWCGRTHGGDYPDTWHQSCTEPSHQPGHTALLHRLAFTPTKRIYGPTHGLDRRLWSGDHLKHDVQVWILQTLNDFWKPVYGETWHGWARVYFAGSEASEWTSKELVGNNDFDILVGVNYEAARKFVPSWHEFSDEDITAVLNERFREGLTPKTDPSVIEIEGNDEGPFSVTWYVNQDSWDIRDIKPYAAYNVSADVWAVRPPHLPDWSIKDFPKAFVAEARAVEAYVKAVLKLPEPMRAQQCDALWRHLHSDRSRAFSPQGEGWIDPGNALEKFLDQAGLWEQLAEVHFDAVAHPEKLLAPVNWSNDPRTWQNWDMD
jgi:hypothetical protein